MSSWFQLSPYDVEIEKATSETNLTELWDVIITICDKIKLNGSTKEALKSILRRVGHSDPHVVVQAITLLDACVINCGKPFHLEVASRDFESEFKKLLSKHEQPIPLKLKLILKKWAENEFKDDPALDLIPSLYKQLKAEGHDFTDAPAKTVGQTFNKDPNVVSSQQEEEDIAKAIEMSLKEQSKGSPKGATQSLIYPSVPMSSSITTAVLLDPRKVRALYDFEAAEDNELTFSAGEMIYITDDTDQNWWKGYSKRGEGLFPSNFVTADLNIEPESLIIDQSKNMTMQFEDIKSLKEDIQLEIEENKIDRLIHLLSEANPEDPSQDTEELLVLENQVNQMGPLIDTELERVDRKHAQLTLLSKELVDAINLYHTLMRESDRPMGNVLGFMPQQPGMYGMFHPNVPQVYMPGAFIQQMPGSGMIPSTNGPHSLPSASLPPGVLNAQHPQTGMIPSQQFPNGNIPILQQNPHQSQHNNPQQVVMPRHSHVAPGVQAHGSNIAYAQHVGPHQPGTNMSVLPSQMQLPNVHRNEGNNSQDFYNNQMMRTQSQIPTAGLQTHAPNQQQIIPMSSNLHDMSAQHQQTMSNAPQHTGLPNTHLNSTLPYSAAMPISILQTDSKPHNPIYHQQR